MERPGGERDKVSRRRARVEPERSWDEVGGEPRREVSQGVRWSMTGKEEGGWGFMGRGFAGCGGGDNM